MNRGDSRLGEVLTLQEPSPRSPRRGRAPVGFEVKGNNGSYTNGPFLILGDDTECIRLARLRIMAVARWLRLEVGAEAYIPRYLRQ